MATIEQRIYDGNRAKEILENPAFEWAFDAIKQELTEAWEQSPSRDNEAREKIYLTLKMLGKLKATLTSSLETGKLAELERLHKQTMLEKAKEAAGLL